MAENWYVHPGCDRKAASWLMKMFNTIKTLHEKFKETVYIDLNRVHLLYDEKGEILKERWDEQSPFWTQENPLPINVIQNDNELLELWQLSSDQKYFFPQDRNDVHWLFQIRNLHQTTNMAVVCQDVIVVPVTPDSEEPTAKDNPNESTEPKEDKPNESTEPMDDKPKEDKPKEVYITTLTAYLIQKFVNEKGETDYVLTMEPNSKLQWYCRYCCRANVSNLVCARCKPPAETDPNLENYSKPGVFYCDKKCQTSDWRRHKLECQPVQGLMK